MVNTWTASGRLGRDPVYRETKNGEGFATASIADSSKWKDKSSGETKEATTWINIKIWGPQAKPFADSHRKGDYASVSGEYRLDNYMKDGEKKQFPYMKVNRWSYVKDRSQQNATQGSWGSNPAGQAPSTPKDQGPSFPDDVPF